MTIRTVADRDQAAAELRDAHADLSRQRIELYAYLRLLTSSLIDVSRDIADIEHKQRQVAAIRFDVTR
jgi:hypothetical protein